jgi:hypothetical protein
MSYIPAFLNVKNEHYKLNTHPQFSANEIDPSFLNSVSNLTLQLFLVYFTIKIVDKLLDLYKGFFEAYRLAIQGN